jgi:hypothetical protein
MESKMIKAEAYCGDDVIRNSDYMPVKKTQKQWQIYANKQAEKQNFRLNKFSLVWSAVVSWIPTRNAYRINYASQSK